MRLTEQQVEQALQAADIVYRVAPRSFVIHTCPHCGGINKVMAFRDGGNGRCLKCGWTFNAIQLIMEAGSATAELARRYLGLREQQSRAATGELLAPALLLDTSLAFDRPRREAARIALPDDCIPIEHDFITKAGIAYLARRGVDLACAVKHDLQWWPDEKRIVIPVYDGERVCRGWQARDITGKARLKITSPAGFTKALTLMGYECLDRSRDWLILSEGPFDFLRLDRLGNSVCSMGAEVSDSQIEMIRRLDWVRTVYLGLDPDAFDKLERIKRLIGSSKRVMLIRPPEDRQLWLDSTAQKSDFGNCNDDGIDRAFGAAFPYDHLRAVGESVLKMPAPWRAL